MARLPQVGGDDGNWGDLLNQFLVIAHSDDGALKPTAVTQAIGAASLTASQLSAGGGTNGRVLTYDSTAPSGMSWQTPTVSGATGYLQGQFVNDLSEITPGTPVDTLIIVR